MTSDIVAMPKGVAKDEQKVTRGIRYSTPRTKTQMIYDYIAKNGPCSSHDIIEGLSKDMRYPLTSKEVGIRISSLIHAGMIEKVQDSFADSRIRSNCTWRVKA